MIASGTALTSERPQPEHWHTTQPSDTTLSQNPNLKDTIEAE